MTGKINPITSEASQFRQVHNAAARPLMRSGKISERYNQGMGPTPSENSITDPNIATSEMYPSSVLDTAEHNGLQTFCRMIMHIAIRSLCLSTSTTLCIICCYVSFDRAATNLPQGWNNKKVDSKHI